MKISLIVSALSAAVVLFATDAGLAFNSLDRPKAEERVEKRIEKLVKQLKNEGGGEMIATSMRLYTLRAGQVLCGYNKPTGDGEAAQKEADKKMTECLNLLLETESLEIRDRFPRFCEMAKLKGAAQKDCDKDADRANREMRQFADRFVIGGEIHEKFSEDIIDASHKFGTEEEAPSGHSGGRK